MDFRFHVPDEVIEALRGARFHVAERVEREPYEGVEHPSRRCYLLARAAEAMKRRTILIGYGIIVLWMILPMISVFTASGFPATPRVMDNQETRSP